MTTTADKFSMGEAFDDKADANSNSKSVDPLSALSRTPRMDRSGYYVDGGLSPYSVEFLKPLNSFFADWPAGESLLSYVRKMQTDEKAMKSLLSDGLPEGPLENSPFALDSKRRPWRFASLRSKFSKRD